MDEVTVPLIAAAIAATVAALTFAIGEVLKIRMAREDRVYIAYREVRAALNSIPEGGPVGMKRSRGIAGTALFDLLAVVPRRDRVFVFWVQSLLSEAEDDFEQIVAAGGQVAAELNFWWAGRRARRAYARRVVGVRSIKIRATPSGG